MSEGIPEATLYFLRSLNAGGEFHAFPKGTDWPRLKSFRTPYQCLRGNRARDHPLPVKCPTAGETLRTLA
jgi:hypothetical protein